MTVRTSASSLAGASHASLAAPPIRTDFESPRGYRGAKRALDITIATAVLVPALPLMVALALWIRMDSPGPALYRGLRVGRGGELFRMVKFRSMVDRADALGGPTTSEDDARLTRPGRFMRRWKLDELPQLAHVLSGRMSLVGPRPDVPSEIAKLSPAERRAILRVPPGMTDWASLRYFHEGVIVRNHPDPHEAYETLIRPGKTRLQLQYVRTASLTTDLRILVATARAVAGREPVVPEDVAQPIAERSFAGRSDEA